MGKSIAVAGGGIMGCLAALALANDGHSVSLFERQARLLTRASRQNEGKIHLGFTYGLDRSGLTQALMFEHGVRFTERLRRILRTPVDGLLLHRRAICAVEASSMLPPDDARRHFAMIDKLHEAYCEAGGPPLNQEWPFVAEINCGERRRLFSDRVIAAYEICEPYADVAALCDLIDTAVRAHEGIDVHNGVEIALFAGADRPAAVDGEGRVLGRFDAAVNAAWDGLAAVGGDAKADDLCLRAKAGFIVDIAGGRPSVPISFVWGSYGDIVPLSPSQTYISWYPACLMDFTTDLSDGARWYDRVASRFDFEAAFHRATAAFRDLMPGIDFPRRWEDVLAGPILASAKTDIDDPASGLHKRNQFGIFRNGNVFTANTGKFTCAPGLALELAGSFD